MNTYSTLVDEFCPFFSLSERVKDKYLKIHTYTYISNKTYNSFEKLRMYFN